jgi:hypothetical protein
MSECQHHDYTMVEDYIRGLQWSAEATDHEKALVAGNIRGFYEHMQKATTPARVVSDESEPASVVEALTIFTRCAYPCDKSIDPRGYSWCEAYLDQALTTGQAALSTLQSGAEGKDGDANLCRQWFDSMQDEHPGYLELQDYQLAARLYLQCGMRIPNSIGSKLDAALDTALQPGQE